MKRVLALVLSVSMLMALLAACGKGDAASSSPAASSAPAASSSAVTEPAGPTGDATLAFVFKNKTGLTMTAAYLYPAGSADKGDNFLASNYPTVAGAQDYRRMVMIRPAAEFYECYIEYETGETATYDRLNMMESNSLSIKALDEKSGKKDSEVTFTEEEIKATLASGICEEPKAEAAAPAADAAATEPAKAEPAKTEPAKTETKTTAKTETKATAPATTTAPKAEAPKAEAPKAEAPKAEAPKAEAPKAEAPAAPAAKTTTLEFVFKNKTGKELKEAYVYPAGSSDKGANVLKANWKNNTSDADYLNMKLTVADADKYDIHIVATDGSTCTFSGKNLKDAASASMKDMDGTISVKDAAENKI